MLVSQKIDDVSGGVSQQPQGMRTANQMAEQVNAISYFGRASTRRSPLQHVAKLTSLFSGNAKVFLQEIIRSTTERYHMVISNGDLHVFDASTGIEQAVYFPNGKSYLADIGNGFRAVTFGDTTVLVNRGVATKKGTAVSPAPPLSALVSVVQGDYATTFSITVSGITVSYTTSANLAPSTRQYIATDSIALNLIATLQANAVLNAACTFAQFGSTIQITPVAPLGGFTVTTADGLGNAGLIAIMGQVQRTSDLPATAPNGYIVEIVGEPSLHIASQFVQYNSAPNPGGKGVWLEVVKPGALLGFDPSSMPYTLQHNGTFLTNVTAAAIPTFPPVISNPNNWEDTWQFPAGALWPGGMTITFAFYRGAGTGTSDVFSYTVLDGDETSEAIVAKFVTLISASAFYTVNAPKTNQLHIIGLDHSHGVMTSTPAQGLAFPVGAAWFPTPNPTMVPNVLAGLILKNTTDGSTGIVVSNSSTVVVTAGLAGGGRNTFAKGDAVQVVASGTYFVFGQSPWVPREAGTPDADSVPYPSFIGSVLNDAFVYEGRLGFIAKDSVIFSRSGDLYNFFRRTVTQVLDDDPIDVSDILHASSGFHSPVLWNGQLYLWSDIRQYLVNASPALTPSTIGFSAVTEYPNLPTLRPVTAGSRVFFMGLKNGQARLMDYSLILFVSRPGGESVSDHIPTYIQGTPLKIVADDGLGFVAVLTTTGLYVYNYHYAQNQQQRVQQAWGKWTMPANANVLDIGISDGQLSVITQHIDGLYLNSLGLDLLGSANPLQDTKLQAGPLATITVTPNPVSVKRSVAQQFFATGTDAQGNVVPIAAVWSVAAGGGSINSATGLFTAGTSDGTYTNTVVATVGSVSGAATVIVSNIAVATITVSPTPISVSGGAKQQFTAVAKDASGNVIAFTPVWDIVASGGTIDAATGLFTAGGVAGTFTGTIRATSGAVHGLATVVVTAGAVASLTLSPTSATLITNATQQFTVTAKDASGIVLTVTPTWSVVAGGGTISSTGLFQAGASPNTYTNTVKCVVGSLSVFATVTVTVGALATIVITPNPSSCTAGGSIGFTATGYDAAGGIVSITPTWSIVASGGSINSGTGQFTAGVTLGTFPNTVKATSGGINGFATVVVGGGPLATLTLSPPAASVAVGATQQFVGVGKDVAGNTAVITPVWSLGSSIPTDSTYSAVPTVSGSSSVSTFTFPTGKTYPVGSIVTLRAGTVGQQSWSYTLLAPQTGEFIATAFAALVAGTAGFSSTQPTSQSVQVTAGYNYTGYASLSTTAAGGKIDNNGLFTAGTTPSFGSSIVKLASGSIVASASVTVTPGAPAMITLTPSSASVQVLQSQQFGATVRDAFGNVCTGVAVTWVASITEWGNTINANGLYTAGTLAVNDIVTASAGSAQASVPVTVTAAPAAMAGVAVRISLNPLDSSVHAGDTISYTATAYDAYNNVVSGLTFSWYVFTSVFGDTVSGSGPTVTVTIGSLAAGVGNYINRVQVSAPDGTGKTVWGTANINQLPAI